VLTQDGGGLWKNLIKFANDPEVRDLEDRCILIVVHGNDDAGCLHATAVVWRTGDSSTDVHAWGNGHTGLADLGVVFDPALVNRVAGRANRASQYVCEFLDRTEVAVGSATTGNHMGCFGETWTTDATGDRWVFGTRDQDRGRREFAWSNREVLNGNVAGRNLRWSGYDRVGTNRRHCNGGCDLTVHIPSASEHPLVTDEVIAFETDSHGVDDQTCINVVRKAGDHLLVLKAGGGENRTSIGEFDGLRDEFRRDGRQVYGCVPLNGANKNAFNTVLLQLIEGRFAWLRKSHGNGNTD
jgi:hypothetical protein